MKPHTLQRGFDFHAPTAYPSIHLSHGPSSCAHQRLPDGESHHSLQHVSCRTSRHRRRRRPVILALQSDRCGPAAVNPNRDASESTKFHPSRRRVLLSSLLAAGAYFLRPTVSTAEDAVPPPPSPPSPQPAEDAAATAAAVTEKTEETEAVLASRIYDASVIGEPMALGKDKKKVFEKLMNGRVVYLGEAEQVPTRDDKELELEIVKSLKRRCMELDRPLAVAMEAFPSDLQGHLNDFIDGRIGGDALKSFITNWPAERWQEYEPLLKYCREKGIRLIACGTPNQVLRTVQAEGIRGLSKSDRKKYAPPAGSGFISGISPLSRTKASLDTLSFNQTPTFGPTSYLTIQARAVEDYSISQVILQALADGGQANGGMLVVITGASHVMYGSRGTGIPARISRKMQKKNQLVLLLNPERQFIRREGEVPVADFLWYSAARTCSRNCYDRAEIARVMNAAGRRRDALPQDLQKGLDLGLVSPEVLQNFFDLEKYPFISELTHRFQGFRERLLADPKFLNRLAIEESISITTTLLAQYEKRKGRFFEEIDYVITDSLRGAVVDFFTVWLPAPTLSFLSFDAGGGNNIDSLIGLLGSIPDNAFQKSIAGRNWDFNHRVASVVVGGLKLAAVGFVSSIGAVGASNAIFAVRRSLNPAPVTNEKYKRTPILKSAVVYSCFLGVSANLRYQVIAGVIEHRVSELFPSETLLVNTISFVARVINSFWGTQQWIDIARSTGIQSRKTDEIQLEEAAASATEGAGSSSISAIECSSSSQEETSIDDTNNK